MNYDCGYDCVEGCDVECVVVKVSTDLHHSDLQSPTAARK